MSVKKLNYQRILLVFFLLSVFILSIIRVEDTDTWMHLSMGKLIWGLKGLPATEPFVYPAFGEPFSYSSWLFGLIYYLSYLGLNITGVILLKAVVITSAFMILIRDSLRPYKNYVLSIVVMVLIVLVSRHRFTERPETFMMVFLSFSIFSLNAYLYDNKKYIYSLPVVHMLWANCHSSINLMVVPFLAFIAGSMLQRVLSRKNIIISDHIPTPHQMKTVGFVFMASFAASLVSPYFINQYFFGAQFLSTPWFEQEILELQRPEMSLMRWLYIATAFILVTFILNRKRLSIIHLLMIIPFIALAFTAKRFLLMLAIVSGPIIVRNLSSFIDLKAWSKKLNREIALVAGLVWIVAFTSCAMVKGVPFDGGRKKFGFGADYSFVPEFALQYLDKNGVEGRVFNIFQWGGYIIWKDYPRKTVFVDPRGNIPVDLLEKINLAISRPSLMDALADRYGFDVILLNYPVSEVDIPNMAKGLVNPRWALIYWDDAALVYLKRNGKYDHIVQRDEFRFINPANSFSDLINSTKDETNRPYIIHELLRNISETGSSRASLYLGIVYNEVGMYKEAISVLSKVRDIPEHEFMNQAYHSLAYAYEQLGDVDIAIDYYLKILNKQSTGGVLYKIGRLYLKKGDRDHALDYLNKAIKTNRNYAPAYALLMDLYREIGRNDDLKKIRKTYNEVKNENAVTEHFKKGLEAYYGRRFTIALEEFRKSIELNPLDAASYSNIGYIYYDMGNLSDAYAYQKKAIEIDPNCANAHYGLAMIYQAQHDLMNEKKELTEYLMIEPAGYFSRRAQNEIEQLNKILNR
jgi:tetratricopeptide (TPR) repeat protein